MITASRPESGNCCYCRCRCCCSCFLPIPPSPLLLPPRLSISPLPPFAFRTMFLSLFLAHRVRFFSPFLLPSVTRSHCTSLSAFLSLSFSSFSFSLAFFLSPHAHLLAPRLSQSISCTAATSGIIVAATIAIAIVNRFKYDSYIYVYIYVRRVGREYRRVAVHLLEI